MDRKEKEILDLLEQVHKQHEGELQAGFRAVAQNIIQHGMSPKEALGITNTRTEALYAEGYKLYNAGHLKRALPFFELLNMIDNKEPRFLFGYAACQQGLKHYKEAVAAYVTLAHIDIASPFPLFHAADCLMHEGDALSSLIVLDMAIARAGDNANYATLKERALLIKEGLIQKIKKGGQGHDKQSGQPQP